MKQIILVILIIVSIPQLLLGRNLNAKDSTAENLNIIINPEYTITRLDKKISDFISFKFGIRSEKNEFGVGIGKLIYGHKFQSPLTEFKYLVKFDIINFETYYKKYSKLNNNFDLYYGLGIGVGEVKIENKERELIPFTEGLQASDTYFFIKPSLGIEYEFLKNTSFNLSIGYNLTSGLDMKSKETYRIYNDPTINFSENNFNDFFLSMSVKYLINVF